MNAEWVWNDLSWQLQNDSGIKVWLVRRLNLEWNLHIGDMRVETLPAFLDDESAKRMALGKTIGYLRTMITNLERMRRW